MTLTPTFDWRSVATRRRLVLGIALVSLCGVGATACTTGDAPGADGTPSTDQASVVEPSRQTPPTPPLQGTPSPDPTPPTDGPDDGATDPVDPGAAPAATTKPTTVDVTFGGWQAATASVEVGGYAGVVEEDGTCTLQLSQGSTSVTASSPGSPDATTTSCGTLTIAGTSLRPGTWTGVLRYESPRTVGESTSITIEVPR